jgi:hypothetical protein
MTFPPPLRTFRLVVNVIVHAFVLVVLCPLTSVLKIGGESPFCWHSLLQRFPCLVEVNLGVAGWHLCCAEDI